MKPKAWYRDAPTLISLLAVVFSLTTAFASYRQVEIQSKREARGELRGLIQRLTAMPLEQAETYKNYKDDPNTLGNLTSNWNSEYLLLANQAAELTKRIPEGISAPEYFMIAQALTNQGIIEPAADFIKAGIEVSNDINSHTALIRSRASHEFLTGDMEKGRKSYEEAITLPQKYSINPYVAKGYTAETKMIWAYSEYNSGNCDQARQLSAEAGEDISGMLPNVYKDNYSKQLVSANEYREANQQVCQ